VDSAFAFSAIPRDFDTVLKQTESSELWADLSRSFGLELVNETAKRDKITANQSLQKNVILFYFYTNFGKNKIRTFEFVHKKSFGLIQIA